MSFNAYFETVKSRNVTDFGRERSRGRGSLFWEKKTRPAWDQRRWVGGWGWVREGTCRWVGVCRWCWISPGASGVFADFCWIVYTLSFVIDSFLLTVFQMSSSSSFFLHRVHAGSWTNPKPTQVFYFFMRRWLLELQVMTVNRFLWETPPHLPPPTPAQLFSHVFSHRPLCFNMNALVTKSDLRAEKNKQTKTWQHVGPREKRSWEMCVLQTCARHFQTPSLSCQSSQVILWQLFRFMHQALGKTLNLGAWSHQMAPNMHL